MWPWGHLAVEYLAVSFGHRFSNRPATLGPLLLSGVIVGTQFPDTVDKPLAYWMGILPEGRSLAHSVLMLLSIGGLIWYQKEHGRAHRFLEGVMIGWITHLGADALIPLFEGDTSMLSFPAYPLLSPPAYTANTFDHHLVRLQRFEEKAHNFSRGRMSEQGLTSLEDPEHWLALKDPFISQVWLSLIALGLWVGDGYPPFASLYQYLNPRIG